MSGEVTDPESGQNHRRPSESTSTAQPPYPPWAVRLVWIIGIGTFIATALFGFFDVGTKAMTKGGEFFGAIVSYLPWGDNKKPCNPDMHLEEYKKCKASSKQ